MFQKLSRQKEIVVPFSKSIPHSHSTIFDGRGDVTSRSWQRARERSTNGPTAFIVWGHSHGGAVISWPVFHPAPVDLGSWPRSVQTSPSGMSPTGHEDQRSLSILCLHIRLTCSPYTIVGLPTMFQNQATTQQLVPDRRLLIQRALMALQRIYRSYTVSQCLKQISLHSIAIVPNMFTSTL